MRIQKRMFASLLSSPLLIQPDRLYVNYIVGKVDSYYSGLLFLGSRTPSRSLQYECYTSSRERFEFSSEVVVDFEKGCFLLDSTLLPTIWIVSVSECFYSYHYYEGRKWNGLMRKVRGITVDCSFPTVFPFPSSNPPLDLFRSISL